MNLSGVTLATFALFAGIAVAGDLAPASADSEEPGICNFALSEPTLTQVSGITMVTASLTPGACTGMAKPTFTQVCLQAAGSSTAGRCAELPGYNTARVYLSPYQPGVAYTARGRGCGARSLPPESICTTVGPTTATL